MRWMRWSSLHATLEVGCNVDRSTDDARACRDSSKYSRCRLSVNTVVLNVSASYHSCLEHAKKKPKPGEKLDYTGWVLDGDGSPVAGAIIAGLSQEPGSFQTPLRRSLHSRTRQ